MTAQNPTHTDVYTPPSSGRKGASDIVNKEAISERVGEVRERARNLYETGKERAVEWEGNFERYVQDRPIKAVLTAAGVGLVLGLILARR